MFLSAAAYLLREAIRRLDLADTELARAQVGTTRLKLLKLGAIIVRNTRRVCLPFSTACPLQELFVKVAHRLSARTTLPPASNPRWGKGPLCP